MAKGNETANETPDETVEEGLWVCPWCGVDQRSKATYYRHLRKCDKCPEDKVEDADRTPAHVVKKEEPFIINIFEAPPEEAPGETPARPPKRKEEEPPEEEEKPEEKKPDEYKCGACGNVETKKFRYCPVCAAENEWAE